MGNPETDFTRTEILVLLSMGLVLVVVVFSGIKIFTRENDVDRAAFLISSIKTSTQQSFQGKPSYMTGDLRPKINAPETSVHPWGGDVLVYGNNQTFFITFLDVPVENCMQMAFGFDRRDVDYISLKINETLFIEGNSEMNPDTLQEACNAQTPVVMIWNYY